MIAQRSLFPSNFMSMNPVNYTIVRDEKPTFSGVKIPPLMPDVMYEMAESTVVGGLGGAVYTLFTYFPDGSVSVGASEVSHLPSTRNLYSTLAFHGILTVAVNPDSSLAR